MRFFNSKQVKTKKAVEIPKVFKNNKKAMKETMMEKK